MAFLKVADIALRSLDVAGKGQQIAYTIGFLIALTSRYPTAHVTCSWSEGEPFVMGAVGKRGVG